MDARCSEVLIMNNEEYEKFSNSLLNDYNFLEGLKCRTDSDWEPDREVEHFYQLTKSERDAWMRESYRLATMIYNKDTDEKFYINTEGYQYARYCLFD